MAIKIYQSQVRPTAETSDVKTNPNMRVSMATAGAVGSSLSNLGKSGTQLFRTYEIRKSQNEALEKERQLIEGTNNIQGLSELQQEASNMTDPDAAKKFYKDGYDKIVNSLTNNYNHNFTKDLFKSTADKHFLKGSIAVTNAANKKFAIHSKNLEIEKQNKLSKDFAFAETTNLQDIANADANSYWNSDAIKDLYGAETVARKNAWFKERDLTYAKRLVVEDKDAGLAFAKKSKYLDAKDVSLVENTRVSVAKENTQILKNQIKEVENNLKKFTDVTDEEYASMVLLGQNTDDPNIQQRLNDVAIKRGLLEFLQTQNRQQLNDLASTADSITQLDRIEGVNTDRDKRVATDFIKSFAANFTEQMDKDPIGTAAKTSFYDTDSLPINDLTLGGDISEFVTIAKKRKTIGALIAAENNAPKRFFTNDERKQLTNFIENTNDTATIERTLQSMSLAFGSEADEAFQEIGQTTNGQIFAYLGGLSLITDESDVVRNAIKGKKLIDDGFVANIPKQNQQYTTIISEYKSAFPDNPNTFTSAIKVADYIYTNKIFSDAGKKVGNTNFNADLFEDSLKEAIGEVRGPDGKKYGGTTETSRNKLVHIPNFIKQDDFAKVEEILKLDENLLQKAAGDNIPIDVDGNKLDIFANENPHFVSVGYGKYIIFLGDHPTDEDPNLEPVLNGAADGSVQGLDYFKINLNLIKDDLILKLKK